MKICDNKDTIRRLPNDHETCEMLLRLANPYHVMAWIMVETGIRVSDMELMPVHSFRQAKGELVVTDGAGRRNIPLSAGLTAALGDYVAGLRPSFEKRNYRQKLLRHFTRTLSPVRFADSLLFPSGAISGFESPHADEPIPVSWFVQALEEAARECGYPGLVHSNTLRHACAKRWMEQGLALAEVNQRLGHSDVMTTMLMAQALQFGGLTFTTAA